MDKITNKDHSINSVTFFTNYGNDPCAYLRLRGPMSHLGIEVIDGVMDHEANPNLIGQGDAIIMQRDFPRDLPVYEQVVQIARQEKKPIIFDIDDLLLLMPEEHPDRQSQYYIESLLPMMQALYEADLITTTTPLLQNWLGEYNDNVCLLPNYFDDALWQLREPHIRDLQNQPLIIGYMGSESHLPDIEFIAPVLLDLLKTYPHNLLIHFWGAKPPKSIANFPQVKWIPAVSYMYEDFAAYFQTQYADIFIAPLVDNLFNRAKSPLKFFEYTALGVPGVYSKLETFEQAITHKQDGFLASAHEEWEEYLTILINDRELRLETAQKAQNTIREKWLLSEHSQHWRKAYEEIYRIHQNKNLNNTQGVALVKSLNYQYYTLLDTLKDDISENEEEIARKAMIIREKDNNILALNAELSTIRNSRAWKMVLAIRKVRDILAPPNTLREKFINSILQWHLNLKAKRLMQERKENLDSLLDMNLWSFSCHQVPKHKEDVDIIVCVHNALEDVKNCLASIVANTSTPFSIILVDDGSDDKTKQYLSEFSNSNRNCHLIHNDTALGYTLAANVGMKASTAPFIVLLNSDTIVTPNWLDRLYRAISKEEKTGIVGPLSNTASWQSIPELSENGDWAINNLPNGITEDEQAQLIAKYSACIHSKVPLLNGFCMMIRKSLIDEIGIFDEDNFGQGYGEEDDFNIRAGKAGWNSVLADDAYIYHAQSKSYSNEKRFALQKISGENLRNKHGANNITKKVEFMHSNRVLEGIRARSRIMIERENIIASGNQQFKGRSILFILPVLDAGGGANVILDEAKQMVEMGVKISIFNLQENKTGFLKNYAHTEIPCIFGKTQDLPDIASSFDAVVASANYSVPWLKPLRNKQMKPILGYYVQGFEPLMYKEGSQDYQRALESYTSIEGIKRFTKTHWTRNQVFENTGVDSEVVGISVNIDLFRPRDMIPMGLRPVTIVAMLRPGSPYRNPEMTASLLRHISKKYKQDVDILLFGADSVQEVVDESLLDFDWRQLGKLTQIQVAAMMSKADIFTDFSSHQAMGLSALEAMAAGCSVIVPKNGGAIEFVDHHVNGMIADTSIYQASTDALEELIENDLLRKQIQIKGINHVVQYFPERVSYNILCALFSK